MKMVRVLFFVIIAGCMLSCSKEETVGVDPRKLLDAYGPQVLCADLHIGDEIEGEELFNRLVLGKRAGCIACHSIQKNEIITGPSLFGIATKAEKRIPGTSAANYLYTAIISPNYHLVDGYKVTSMPSYMNVLSAQEIDDIIGYLMTLTEEKE